MARMWRAFRPCASAISRPRSSASRPSLARSRIDERGAERHERIPKHGRLGLGGGLVDQLLRQAHGRLQVPGQEQQARVLAHQDAVRRAVLEVGELDHGLVERGPGLLVVVTLQEAACAKRRRVHDRLPIAEASPDLDGADKERVGGIELGVDAGVVARKLEELRLGGRLGRQVGSLLVEGHRLRGDRERRGAIARGAERETARAASSSASGPFGEQPVGGDEVAGNSAPRARDRRVSRASARPRGGGYAGPASRASRRRSRG